MLRQLLTFTLIVTLISLTTADKKSEFCFKTVNSRLDDSYFRITAEIVQGTDPSHKNPWTLIEGLSGHEYSVETQEMIGYASGLRYVNESGSVEEFFVASLRGEHGSGSDNEFAEVHAPNTFQRARAIAWNNELRIGGEYFVVSSDPSQFLFKLESNPVELEMVLLFPCNETSEVLCMSPEEQALAALVQMGVKTSAASDMKVTETQVPPTDEEVCFRKNGLGGSDVHVPFHSRNEMGSISYYAKLSFPSIFSSVIKNGRIHHLCFLNARGPSPYVKVLTTTADGVQRPLTRPYVDFTESGYVDLMSFTGIPGAADYWTC